MSALVGGGAALEAAAADGHTPLMRAVALQRVGSATALMAAGASLEPAGPRRDGPLHVAADESCLTALLDAGANPNARGKDGETLLRAALGWRDTALAHRLLSKYGADPNAVGRQGTPLHQAASQNSYQLAKLLLRLGADPAAVDRGNALPGLFAQDRVRSLLERALLTAHLRTLLAATQQRPPTGPLAHFARHRLYDPALWRVVGRFALPQ